jgi:hypothetical protein
MRKTGGIALAAAVAAFSGCSTITANNAELLAARQGLASGDTEAALAAVSPDERDDLPAILDRAVILQTQGRCMESNAEFDRAIQQVRDYEARALVSGTEVGAGAGSLLLNDKVLEYQGEGFEKVLMHSLKARNYLMLGDAEAARVEMRNANMRQDEERKRNEAAIEEAQKEGEGKYEASEIDKQFANAQAALSRLDNVYQNPFATYLSGVVYELNGEPGDAFIDYKLAYQMVPNPLVGADLARLAVKLHRVDELAEVGVSAPVEAAEQAGGNTLIFIDNGLAPERVEVKFPLPGPGTVLFAAVPMTQPVGSSLAEAEVVDADGQVVGHTQMLVDVEAMSVRNLKDQYPAILTRQAVRLAAKAAAGAVAENQLGAAGLLLTSAVNAVTEQADLRGWYALPRSIHLARVNLPPDQSEVTLRLLDASGQPLQEVPVPVVTAGNSPLRIAAIRYIDGQVIASAPPAVQFGEAR